MATKASKDRTELSELDLASLVDRLRAAKQEALNLRFRSATTANCVACVAVSPVSTPSSVSARSRRPRPESEPDVREHRNSRAPEP
jgi:hypothetical protein